MNINRARIGLLFATTTPLATTTVVSYDADTFTLICSPSAFAFLSLDGVALADDEGYVRIRSKVDNQTLKLAENAHSFDAGDTISVYNIRLPFPRYQRIASDGTIFKDYDLAWTTDNAAKPPQAMVSLKNPVTGLYSEAVWCDVDDDIEVTALASRALASGGDPLAFSYDMGSWASLSGSGDTVTITPIMAGFRYLKVTVTDQHGTAAYRYTPFWVGSTPFETLTSCRLSWSVNRGWTLEGSVIMPPTYLERSPVALVDLDTRDVLFFGFLEPGSTDYDFEQQVLSFRALSALAFAERLYSYPFILTTATSPASWAELGGLSLSRALHFLLRWHSTIPEIANVTAGDPGERLIKGQEFTGGTIAQQMRTLASAAFWELRGYRGGGFSAVESMLYRQESSFTGADAADLSDGADMEGMIEREHARPIISEARLSGVYYNGSSGDPWTPIIIAAPSHPGDLGSPTDLRSLAPVSQAEIERWAARHIGLENAAERYTLHPRIDVDPATSQLADLPEDIRIAVEDVRMVHDANVLAWKMDVSGRTYGQDASVVVVPIPPEVVVPEPSVPSVDPPFYPVIPPVILEWPTTLYLGTNSGGIYHTSDFTGPDDVAQPTWTAVNGGLPDLRCVAFHVDPFSPADYQYLHGYDGSGRACLYRRLGSGNWEEMLTIPDVMSLTGLPFGSGGYLYLTPNRTVAGQIECFAWAKYEGSRLLRSVDHGESWAVQGTTSLPGLNTYGYWYPFVAVGDVLYIRNNWPLYGNYILRTLNSGVSWSLSTSQIGALAGRVVSSALTNVIYAQRQALSNDLAVVGFDGSSHTIIQDALDLFYGFGHLWLSDIYPSWQRVLRNAELVETLDSWTTASVITTLDKTYQHFIMLHPDEAEREDWMILGYGTPTVDLPHTIFALDLDGSGSPVGKSGASPGVSPYTGSIPYTAGGICAGGVQVVA